MNDEQQQSPLCVADEINFLIAQRRIFLSDVIRHYTEQLTEIQGTIDKLYQELSRLDQLESAMSNAEIILNNETT